MERAVVISTFDSQCLLMTCCEMGMLLCLTTNLILLLFLYSCLWLRKGNDQIGSMKRSLC
jgi:hypothetical protein